MSPTNASNKLLRVAELMLNTADEVTQLLRACEEGSRGGNPQSYVEKVTRGAVVNEVFSCSRPVCSETDHVSETLTSLTACNNTATRNGHGEQSRTLTTSNEHDEQSRTLTTSNEHAEQSRTLTTSNEHAEQSRIFTTSSEHDDQSRTLTTSNEHGEQSRTLTTSNEHAEQIRTLKTSNRHDSTSIKLKNENCDATTIPPASSLDRISYSPDATPSQQLVPRQPADTTSQSVPQQSLSTPQSDKRLLGSSMTSSVYSPPASVEIGSESASLANTLCSADRSARSLKYKPSQTQTPRLGSLESTFYHTQLDIATPNDDTKRRLNLDDIDDYESSRKKVKLFRSYEPDIVRKQQQNFSSSCDIERNKASDSSHHLLQHGPFMRMSLGFAEVGRSLHGPDISRGFSWLRRSKMHDKKQEMPQRRQVPNYCICIRVTDCKVLDTYRAVQHELQTHIKKVWGEQQEHHFDKMFPSASSAHIKLLSMHLGSEQAVNQAVKQVESFRLIWPKDVNLNLTGTQLVSIDQVLCTQPRSGCPGTKKLHALRSSVLEHMEEVDCNIVSACDGNENWRPFLTLANKIGTRSSTGFSRLLPSSSYAHFIGEEFGSMTVNGIHLCPIVTAPNEDEFLPVLATAWNEVVLQEYFPFQKQIGLSSSSMCLVNSSVSRLLSQKPKPILETLVDRLSFCQLRELFGVQVDHIRCLLENTAADFQKLFPNTKADHIDQLYDFVLYRMKLCLASFRQSSLKTCARTKGCKPVEQDVNGRTPAPSERSQNELFPTDNVLQKVILLRTECWLRNFHMYETRRGETLPRGPLLWSWLLGYLSKEDMRMMWKNLDRINSVQSRSSAVTSQDLNTTGHGEMATSTQHRFVQIYQCGIPFEDSKYAARGLDALAVTVPLGAGECKQYPRILQHQLRHARALGIAIGLPVTYETDQIDELYFEYVDKRGCNSMSRLLCITPVSDLQLTIDDSEMLEQCTVADLKLVKVTKESIQWPLVSYFNLSSNLVFDIAKRLASVLGLGIPSDGSPGCLGFYSLIEAYATRFGSKKAHSLDILLESLYSVALD